MDTKLYEAIGLQHEKIAEYIKSGNKIVYDFVKERGLIITGGLAIDILLRTKGLQIYPDELTEFPDIDCISTDSVGDSQELAQILHDKGFPNVSAISALHILTRRVRCDNRVLADITYVPANIFDKIPFIEIAGQKIIHPWYQHLDQHMLMSKPFVDPPKETIINRLKKDVTRYNLLDEAFPIAPTIRPKRINIAKIKIPAEHYPHYKELDIATTIHGLAAYAALIESAKHLLGDNWAKVESDDDIVICSAEFDKAGQYTFESISPTVQLLLDLPDDKKKPYNITRYEPILDLVPETWKVNKSNTEFWIFTGTLLSVGVGRVSGKDIIIPSIQYVMMFILTQYYFGDPADAPNYLILYCSLKKLLQYLEPLYDDTNPAITNSPFFLPLKTIGRINISQSQVISLLRIRQNIGEPESQLMCLPSNYWPATSRPIKEFDYTGCEFFRKGGEKI